MKVRLGPELFERSGDDLSLLGLFEHGWQGEHRIDVDLEHPAVTAWLERQSRDVHEQCRLAVDASAHEEALSPAAISIVVTGRDTSDWSAAPPRLCLADARAVLRRPFEIFVEDSTSDRAFLRRMMTPEELALVERLETAERLRFVHGGGSSLRTQVQRRAEDPGAPLQTWVLMDSDAMRPGAPSTLSEEICQACVAAGIPFHRLGRRYIESYLPVVALERWGAARPSKRQELLPMVRAFARMSDAQRYHYNMKGGFEADEERSTEAGSLYDGLTPRDRERLSRGFGRKIGELFQDRYPGAPPPARGGERYVHEQELRRDGGWDELRPAVREMLARLGGS